MLNLRWLVLVAKRIRLTVRLVMLDRLELPRPPACGISRPATADRRSFPPRLSAFHLLRRFRTAPTPRLDVGLDPAAEDFVHHVEPTAKQEVHRSIAAAKDVAGFRVDLF